MNGQDIVTTSNADIDLAPNGTGKVVVKGNSNPGTIVFNCESNSHGQTVKSQPHSASVTNVLTLPPGGDQEIVGTQGQPPCPWVCRPIVMGYHHLGWQRSKH